MKESSWHECVDNNAAIKVTPDKARAKSLVETAGARMRFLDENKIKDSNASFIFEGYYTSAIEILHAFLLEKGYKIENHVCLGYYIRDMLRKETLFRLFDSCRYNRNSLVYYGKQMSMEIAIKSIRGIRKLIAEIREIVRQ